MLLRYLPYCLRTAPFEVTSIVASNVGNGVDSGTGVDSRHSAAAVFPEKDGEARNLP